MKKLLFILIALFTISISSYAFPKADSTQISEAERIVDKYVGQVSEGVGNMVEALEQPAKEIFNTVVTLQIIKGVACIISLLTATILFFIIGFRIVRKYFKLCKDFNKEHNLGPDSYSKRNVNDYDMGILGIILLVISGCTFIAFLASLYYSLSHIFAAEWYAIIEITTLIKA